jgi:molecular chaperone DnaK (HSP70)
MQTPAEILSTFLRRIRQIIEGYCHIKSDNTEENTDNIEAFITVSRYSTDENLQTIKDAATSAGINVLRLWPDPSSAVAAYRLEEIYNNGGENHVLIVDIGSSGYQVSLYNIEDRIYELKNSTMDRDISGNTLDDRLFLYCSRLFFEEHGKQLNVDEKGFIDDPYSIRRLRNACERAKCELSHATEADIHIPFFHHDIDFKTTITRKLFESLCEDLFEKLVDPVERLLERERVKASEIQGVVLSGGSLLMPRISKILSQYFAQRDHWSHPDFRIYNSIDPREVVAYGATMEAASMSAYGYMNERSWIGYMGLSLMPLTLGIETIDGIVVPIIRHLRTLPTRVIKLFSAFPYRQSTTPTAGDLSRPLWETTSRGSGKATQAFVAIRLYDGYGPYTRNCKLIGRLEIPVSISTNTSRSRPFFQRDPLIEITVDVDDDYNIAIVAVEELDPEVASVFVEDMEVLETETAGRDGPEFEDDQGNNTARHGQPRTILISNERLTIEYIKKVDMMEGSEDRGQEEEIRGVADAKDELRLYILSLKRRLRRMTGNIANRSLSGGIETEGTDVDVDDDGYRGDLDKLQSLIDEAMIWLSVAFDTSERPNKWKQELEELAEPIMRKLMGDGGARTKGLGLGDGEDTGVDEDYESLRDNIDAEIYEISGFLPLCGLGASLNPS